MAKYDDILDNLDYDPNDPEYRLESIGPDEQVQVVGKYYSQLEANVAAARLSHEGIPCVIENEATHGLLPSQHSYVNLFVRAVDVPLAREVLAELEHSEPSQTSSSMQLENILLIGILALLVFLAIVAMGLNR